VTLRVVYAISSTVGKLHVKRLPAAAFTTALTAFKQFLARNALFAHPPHEGEQKTELPKTLPIRELLFGGL